MPSLGPDDIGRRAVVRYLTGGTAISGRPELTDVIGHIRSLDAAVVTLETKDGSTVSVAWSDVVACKVVPEGQR